MKILGNIKEARIELENDKNNAVAQLLNIKNNVKGPLENCVFTIKDIFATSFAPTQASSNILKNFKPHYTADSVQLLLDAGALPIAKVHNDELALGGTGTFSSFGIIRNPLDSTRLAGGSSSGSVATFTDNISFALASDTGDSVRLPASYVGCVGYKPSYGAISRYGMFAYSSSLDTVSYFAHNVNDIAILSKVLFKKSKNDMTSKEVKIDNIIKTKPQKIAILNFENYSKDYVWNEVLNLEKMLKNQQISTKFIEINLDLMNSIKPLYDIISYAEASSNLANLNGIAFSNRIEKNEWQDTYKQTRKSGFGKMVQRRLTLGSFFLKNENQKELFLKAAKIRRIYKEYMSEILNEYDVVIYPASNGIAPKFDSKEKSNFTHWVLTGANLVGNPSISIPLGKHNKMPFNITIDSSLYNDEKLLSYSLYIEELINKRGE